mmetsp:Transcript_21340/g.35719  ORF Transcript_21340/g.35719 Transcript_21340/m.35719 type:complete len:293 (+) Transcript_21340:345-1223(+)
MSWSTIVEEARRIAEKDDFMREIVTPVILDQDGFASAIVSLLADQFATPTISSDRWKQLFFHAYDKDLLYHTGMLTTEEMGLQDLAAISDRDPSSDGLVNPFINFKGFKSLQSHRIAHTLWNEGRKDAARAIQSRCSDLYAVDIHPAAVIGPGLMIDHAAGIVVGETATIGSNCSFLHGVTLGSTGKEGGDRHPKIGNDVLIGCNATILGNITISHCCKIGSGSIVLKSLPCGSTAVGNPARVVGRSLCPSAGAGMDTALHHVVTSKGVKYEESYSLWGEEQAAGEETKGRV